MGKIWDNTKWVVQNYKNILGIITLVLPLCGTAYGWYSDNTEKTAQIESGNHAVQTLSGLIHDNKDKIVSHETQKVIHKTVSDSRVTDKLEKRINEIERQIPPNHAGFH